MPRTFWAGAAMSRRRGPPWAARTHCLPVGRAGEQAALALETRDPRTAARLALGGDGREPSPGWEVQLPAGTRKGPGDKVAGTPGQGGEREKELEQMEDFGHSCQVLKVEQSG